MDRFAYIEFADASAVHEAVEKKNGTELNGKEIKVDVATAKRTYLGTEPTQTRRTDGLTDVSELNSHHLCLSALPFCHLNI